MATQKSKGNASEATLPVREQPSAEADSAQPIVQRSWAVSGAIRAPSTLNTGDYILVILSNDASEFGLHFTTTF